MTKLFAATILVIFCSLAVEVYKSALGAVLKIPIVDFLEPKNSSLTYRGNLLALTQAFLQHARNFSVLVDERCPSKLLRYLVLLHRPASHRNGLLIELPWNATLHCCPKPSIRKRLHQPSHYMSRFQSFSVLPNHDNAFVNPTILCLDQFISLARVSAGLPHQIEVNVNFLSANLEYSVKVYKRLAIYCLRQLYGHAAASFTAKALLLKFADGSKSEKSDNSGSQRAGYTLTSIIFDFYVRGESDWAFLLPEVWVDEFLTLELDKKTYYMAIRAFLSHTLKDEAPSWALLDFAARLTKQTTDTQIRGLLSDAFYQLATKFEGSDGDNLSSQRQLSSGFLYWTESVTSLMGASASIQHLYRLLPIDHHTAYKIAVKHVKMGLKDARTPLTSYSLERLVNKEIFDLMKSLYFAASSFLRYPNKEVVDFFGRMTYSYNAVINCFLAGWGDLNLASAMNARDSIEMILSSYHMLYRFDRVDDKCKTNFRKFAAFCFNPTSSVYDAPNIRNLG